MAKASPGTWVERDIFRSDAFLALRGVAPQVLVIFLGKRQFERQRGRKGNKEMVCTNSDNLRFTYKEAADLGITKARFARAIDDLLGKGFLEIERQGGAYRQDQSIYRLSDKWRMWRPGIVFFERAREQIQRGFRKRKRATGGG